MFKADGSHVIIVNNLLQGNNNVDIILHEEFSLFEIYTER